MHGRTTGNPFFVKEVARLLDSQGKLDPTRRSGYAKLHLGSHEACDAAG